MYLVHEISSVEAPEGGKFTVDTCMDNSFIQQPSHIENFSNTLIWHQFGFGFTVNVNFLLI